MKLSVCPHCGGRRIAASHVPKDVVVVLPCPACHELVVLFREKVAALNRKILEHGSFEQRKAHIAEIVMEFLEPGMFPFHATEMPPTDQATEAIADDLQSIFDSEDEDEEESDSSEVAPITQREIDRFVKLELQRIDDSTYFRRHFS